MDFNWPADHGEGFGEASIYIAFIMFIYIAMGLAFAWRAKCRLRKNIF